MEVLYDYCVDINKYIKKCRRYIGLGQYMNGGLILNIIKTLLLKKGFENLKNINYYISNINKELSIIEPNRELKYFQNMGHGTVIYENSQMNAIVYKQLEKLYIYLNEIEYEVKTIKENINHNI